MPNGSKPRTFPLPRQRSLPALLLMLALSLAAAPAVCAEPLPRHQLTVGFDLAAGRIAGTSRFTLPPDRAAQLELGDLTVTSLRLNGSELSPGAADGHSLAIPAADREQTITVSFAKIVPTAAREAVDNLIGAEGITLTGFWHPRLDTPCLCTLEVDVPRSFTAIAEADRTEEEAVDSGRRFRFYPAQPLATLHLVAGEYVVEETALAGDKKLVTYFFKEDAQLAAHYRDKTKGYLARYEKLLGDFPYQRFSVVENRLPTGYAMPTFTLLGQAVARLPFITETSLGHEVLHQWFGNAVEVDYGQGNWAEGLATYLADHAFAEDAGKGMEFRQAQLVKYQSYVPAGNDIPLSRFQGGASHLDSGAQQSRAIGYARGAMFFHMLRQQLGDNAFNQGLRDFYQRLRFRTASWDDLRESFTKASGQDLTDFFTQWLTRADLPELQIKGLKVEEKAERPELSFTIVQPGDTPYRLTVKVLVGINDQRTITPITVTDKETKVVLPQDAPPTELVVDPNLDLMRRLSRDEIPPVWSRFDGAPKKIAVVAEDAGELFAPMLETLQAMGCEIKTAAEATDKDVAAASVIFLNPSSLSRSLFATPAHPATGVTVDVRSNPLHPDAVAVLVTADTTEQIRAAADKLRHYGKYGYLHFENGRAIDKREPEAEHGLAFSLDQPPQAVTVAKTQSFADIVSQLLAARVIYVGEGHTTYEDHLLQLRLIRAIHRQDPKLAIGMEMFNRSAQPALDDYVAGVIDEAEMLRRTEYFTRWGYDYRNYRDIIRFASRHHIPLLALNQQKEVVSKVFKESGTAGLSEEEQKLLPEDRDLDIPGYRERIHSVFTMHAAPTPEQFTGFIQAQALWDETMAATVAEYLTTHPEQRMVVIAGVGHVAKAEAIPPRVARRIDVRQAVVANINSTEADPRQLDFAFLLAPAKLPPAPIMGVVLDEKDGPVRIEQLSPNGQAKKTGLREDDIILAMDDQPVASITDLKVIMLEKKVGDSVRVTIKRPHRIFPDETLLFTIPL